MALHTLSLKSSPCWRNVEWRKWKKIFLKKHTSSWSQARHTPSRKREKCSITRYELRFGSQEFPISNPCCHTDCFYNLDELLGLFLHFPISDFFSNIISVFCFELPAAFRLRRRGCEEMEWKTGSQFFSLPSSICFLPGIAHLCSSWRVFWALWDGHQDLPGAVAEAGMEHMVLTACCKGLWLHPKGLKHHMEKEKQLHRAVWWLLRS